MEDLAGRTRPHHFVKMADILKASFSEAACTDTC